MNLYPKVAIIYLSYNCKDDLPAAVEAWKKLTYPRASLRIVIVDNPHPQHGLSESCVRQLALPLSGQELPEVVYLPQEKNIGFSAGNNVGIKWALEHGCDYVFLHNQDGFLTPGALEPLVNALQNNPKLGATQSLILLFPEIESVNTSGNRFHYLGFGYVQDFQKPAEEIKKQKPEVSLIGYPSGAAVMLRADLLKQYGLLNEALFLYHEDLEYGLRLKTLGFDSAMIKASVFYHRYAFSRNPGKFYWAERNRWAVLLMYYKWPTLILLLPMLLAVEIGLGFFAYRDGWLKEKFKAYGYWLNFKNWGGWFKARQIAQKQRKMGDRALLKEVATELVFDKPNWQSPVLKYIANPILSAYGWLLKKIIFW